MWSQGFDCAPKNKKCLSVEFDHSSQKSVFTNVDSDLIRESFGEGEAASASAKKNVCTRMQNMNLSNGSSPYSTMKKAASVR